MRQTSKSIMKSFQNSGKKHIVITGSIAHGKTSLLNELIHLLDLGNTIFPGITTYLVPDKGVFLRDNCSCKETMIGEVSLDPSTGRKYMKSVSQGFSVLGIKSMREAIESKESWVVIDEIGFLESSEVAFQDMVRQVFNQKQVLCAVRKQDLSFLNELRTRSDVYLVDVDVWYQKVGCVIMASGQGKRFGSNKLLADFNGRPLFQTTFELMDRRLFDEIVVVTRTKEVYEKALQQGFKGVLHNLTDRNDVVRLGVEQMESMDACVFCPCDQPLLKKKSLENLVIAFLDGKHKIFRLAWNDCPGTPVLFSKDFFSALKDLPPKQGGSYLMRQYKDEIGLVYVTDKMELQDIDTKEDLEMISRYDTI